MEITGCTLGTGSVAAPGYYPDCDIPGELTTVRDIKCILTLQSEALVREQGGDGSPHAAVVSINIHAVECGCDATVR